MTLSSLVGHRRVHRGPGWGQTPQDAHQHPAHLLGICTGPIQEQGVEHILPPDEEPVTILIQVEGAEAQEAAVTEEEDGAVGA